MSPADAWAKRADELAAFTLERLVNRDDRCGGYGWRSTLTFPADGPAAGFVDRSLLTKHYAADSARDVIGLHTAAPNQTAKWIGLDFDDHGDGTLGPANLKAAMLCREVLSADGFDCLIEDSNGAGGLHLWVVFGGPVPLAEAHAYAQALGDRCRAAGLPVPECNPKQTRLPADGYGNWLRLPGRHHSRPHWSRIYCDGEWLEGNAAIDAILAIPPGEPAHLSKAVSRLKVRANLNTDSGVMSSGAAYGHQGSGAFDWYRGGVVSVTAVRSRSSDAVAVRFAFELQERHDGVEFRPCPATNLIATFWIVGKDGQPKAAVIAMIDAALGTTNAGATDLINDGLDVTAWPRCQIRVRVDPSRNNAPLEVCRLRRADHLFEAETWLRKAPRLGVGGNRTAQLLNFAKFLAFDLGLDQSAVLHWAQVWNDTHVLNSIGPLTFQKTLTNALIQKYGERPVRLAASEGTP